MKTTEYHDIGKYLPKKHAKRKKGFLVFYLIFLSVLAALGLTAVSYVSYALKEYEAAQPDNMALDCAEEIQLAAKENRLDAVLSFDAVKKEIDITDEEYNRFQQDIADGTLTVKKSADAEDEINVLCYNILLNDISTIAKYKIKSTGQETKLAILTIDKWEKQSLEAAMYSEEFTLPTALTVTLNGEKAEGTLSDDKQTVFYRLCSINKPEIVISDILGNSAAYTDEGKYSIKEYKLTVPSDFTVMGKEPVAPASEQTEPIEQLTDLYDYFPDIPVLCSYDLFVMENEEYSLTLLDNYGDKIDISELGDVITITELSSRDSMPECIENPPDTLEIAKQWSLFMTKDLAEEKYGFYTMAEYLFKDTMQYNRAWEWVTGVDIGFTSLHTLANPPFAKAEATNFIVYTDKCFSCEIYLEKPLYLKIGGVVTDTMHSIFYFGYIDASDNGIDDPHWGIIDTVSILED